MAKSEYFEQEIVEMLTKAEALGYSLQEGSDLEKLTISQLDVLVNVKQ